MSKRTIQIIASAFVVAGLGFIVWSVSVLAQGPTSDQAPNAAEWLSAWSTFWGAIAGGIGAIGTAGALMLGVIVYKRQEEDQRRAQAAAVTVTIAPVPGFTDSLQFKVHNGSSLAIYGVMLIAMDKHKHDIQQVHSYAIPPGESISFQHTNTGQMSARAGFQDSAGRRWRRWFTGELEEITTN